MDLYNLKDELVEQKTGQDYINALLDQRFANKDCSSPAMQQNNLMYIIGAIDALYWSNQITQLEYTLALKYFGL
jgi:hypothetical protein